MEMKMSSSELEDVHLAGMCSTLEEFIARKGGKVRSPFYIDIKRTVAQPQPDSDNVLLIVEVYTEGIEAFPLSVSRGILSRFGFYVMNDRLESTMEKISFHKDITEISVKHEEYAGYWKAEITTKLGKFTTHGRDADHAAANAIRALIEKKEKAAHAHRK